MRNSPIFPSDVKALHDESVDLCETMLKRRRQLTADSLRLTAADGCSAGNTPEPLAVSRKPMADVHQIAALDWQTDRMSIVEFG